MLLPHGTVIAVVDGENFALYRNADTATEPRLEPMEVPALESTNYSAGVQDHDKISRFQLGAPKGKENKLEELAHAAAVTEWLNQQVLQHRIDKLIIIADPRSLGEMRRHYHKKLETVLLCDIDRTLTGARPDAIIKALRDRD
ncbi:MAG: host attachment protein [Novosphingobium sp.]|nr:host attachment protein [Novosphingobium sp.]